ncbi:MAG: hypothetical protein RBR97_07065 [Bacteroidales bacterium]|nr:hypothetical protein [Bacteroidales bacterium]
MGYNEELLSKIQSELNIIASSFLGNEIVFDGEVAFYDYDWIKKQYNKDISPFALTLENSDTTIEGKPITTNQYAIGFLCKEKFRNTYNAIFNAFRDAMIDYTFVEDGFTYNINVNDFQSGEPFNDGSGKGEKLFEQLIGLEVTIMYGLTTGKDVSVSFQNITLPFRSFKILSGVSSYASASSNFSDNSNLLNNKMTFVVEVFIEPSINQLLEYNSLVNVDGDLVFYIANFGYIIDDNARFDGYEMAGEYNGVLTAYLYFTAKGISGNPNTFTIDGLSFPVIDYSIGIKNITKTISVPNSNLTKEVYLGKSRAYVFNVLKTNAVTFATLYNKLVNSLMGEGSTASEEFLTLGIKFGTTTYTKQVMLSEISDDSSNKGIWKITMVEGELL